ncbi:MAG: hypothetical protein ACLRWQ_14005 [Flavonifractor plautii]
MPCFLPGTAPWSGGETGGSEIQTFPALPRLLGALPLWMGALSPDGGRHAQISPIPSPMMVVVLGDCLGGPGVHNVLRMVAAHQGVDWLARRSLSGCSYHLLLTAAPMDVMEVPLGARHWLGLDLGA